MVRILEQLLPGQAVVTMSEGNKKVTVTLTQEANASAQ